MSTTPTTETVVAPILYLRQPPLPSDLEPLRHWRRQPHARAVVIQTSDEPWRSVIKTHMSLRDLVDAHFCCFHREPHPRCWCWVPNPDVIAEAAQRIRTKLYPQRLHPDYPAGHSIISMPRYASVLVSNDEAERLRALEAGLSAISFTQWRLPGS